MAAVVASVRRTASQLARIAQPLVLSVLGVMASAAAPERLFSMGGYLKDDGRASLLPKRLTSMVRTRQLHASMLEKGLTHAQARKALAQGAVEVSETAVSK